jgi:hypothetical protein
MLMGSSMPLCSHLPKSGASHFFPATLSVDVSMDYASAEEKFGANILLEILDLPFKKSVC